jgi:tRNA-Thr(GGU) m(6)t(6)A37 methyltransferase TsaA
MDALKIPMLTVRPIGLIHTAHKERYSAPRQSESASAKTSGRIVLFPGHNYEQALQDLKGFECIWIISWFHQNQTWKTKVQPPRGGPKRRGVFATRSPYRPNPIGLSRATLLEVKGRTLRVEDSDLLDGTPILDIKPYLPYTDSAPQARIGWLEDFKLSGLQHYTLTWSPLACEQLKLLKTFDVDLESSAQRILEMDAEPNDYRRIQIQKDGTRILAIKSWRLVFRIEEQTLTLERIRSGYELDTLFYTQPVEAFHDGAAHAKFMRQWPIY